MNFSATAFLFLFVLSSNLNATTPTQQETFNQLPKQQLFGAEIQYFRLRGGNERNIPRSKVIDLWTRALDAAKAAHMNTVSFYIPWDFHEYAEGQFDFDGTVDEDGDGRPDYPSRDIKTFLRMVKERGFSQVMVRPGPYINAEWGFLGFGAIPLWFHEKYPDSHMRNAQGQRTKLYDYHNPDFHKRTQIWFKAVYDQVIKNDLAPRGMIKFVQVDNETNFMWQSIHNHDFGAPSMVRYRAFLKNQYQTIENLNRAHNTTWVRWEDIQAPAIYGKNISADQDWYRFQDDSIFTYLQKIRSYWEALGLHEPDILFTLAESYNANGQGLLPSYRLRNDRSTGVMTVNLYPKTDETPEKPFLNLPFKSDHDVKAQDTASEFYFGAGNRWVAGPEIQGGWWKGVDVSPEARLQTYLSVIGHGMKAMLVYYFNEGDNWMASWQREQTKPYFEKLRLDNRYAGIAVDALPDTFWKDLQKTVDDDLFVGIDVKKEIAMDPTAGDRLYFDASLDGDANPRNHYFDLLHLGEKLLGPYGNWLGQSVTNYDPVCLLKDGRQHVPSKIRGIDHLKLNSDWEGGLIGYALNAGVNMRVVHWGMNTDDDLKSCQVIIHQDGGQTHREVSQRLKQLVNDGHVVINFLGHSVANQMGITNIVQQNISTGGVVSGWSGSARFDIAGQPLFKYILNRRDCKANLQSNRGTHGYYCRMGQGTFYQVGALMYDAFNSNSYGAMTDVFSRVEFFRKLLGSANLKSHVEIEPKALISQVVAFSRSQPGQPQTWITVKSGQTQPTNFRVIVRDVNPKTNYTVRDLLGTSAVQLTGEDLSTLGFEAKLGAIGSTVYWVEQVPGSVTQQSDVHQF